MPNLDEFLSPGAVVWAVPAYGPIGPNDRAQAFGKEAVARRIEREAQPDRDMILNIGVGTPMPTLLKELAGTLLDIVTIVPRLMLTEDIIGRDQFQRWISDWEDKRWPWGLPIVRAWSFPRHPHADEILPGLRRDRFNYRHSEQMTTRLSPAEIDRIRPLEVVPIVFDIPLVDESGVAAQRRASDRVRRWAGKIAASVASRCRAARPDHVVLRPGYETTETELHLLITKLLQDQHERCALCGGPLDLSEPANPLAQPSADRIDSAMKVYDRSNLQITHLACNLGKRHNANSEALQFFRTWCGSGVPEA